MGVGGDVWIDRQYFFDELTLTLGCGGKDTRNVYSGHAFPVDV